MRNIAILILVVSFMLTASCVKGDKKNTEYRIEASASNIVNVYYKTRDHGPQQVYNYNQSSFSFEWKGYRSNDITLMIECTGSGSVKIYRKGKLEAEKTGNNSVTVNFKD